VGTPGMQSALVLAFMTLISVTLWIHPMRRRILGWIGYELSRGFCKR
jgi:hypothetical protein